MSGGVATDACDPGFDIGDGLSARNGWRFKGNFEGHGGRINDAIEGGVVRYKFGERIIASHLLNYLLSVARVSLLRDGLEIKSGN